jgi:hypothetical protein
MLRINIKFFRHATDVFFSFIHISKLELWIAILHYLIFNNSSRWNLIPICSLTQQKIDKALSKRLLICQYSSDLLAIEMFLHVHRSLVFNLRFIWNVPSYIMNDFLLFGDTISIFISFFFFVVFEIFFDSILLDDVADALILKF